MVKEWEVTTISLVPRAIQDQGKCNALYGMVPAMQVLKDSSQVKVDLQSQELSLGRQMRI